MREALAELPEPSRDVLILYYREETPTAQLAARLGLSEAAARQRLHRAREQLRARLDSGLGDALRRTAPGAAFVLAVLAALPSQAEAAPIGRPPPRWPHWLSAAALLAIGLGFGWWWRSAPGPEERPASQALAPRPRTGAPTPVQAAEEALTPEPASSPVEEAYAALAKAEGMHLIRCPGPRLPDPGPGFAGIGGNFLRWEEGENWFLATSPFGSEHLVQRSRDVATEAPDGHLFLSSGDAEPTRSVWVRWEEGRCWLEEPRTVRFSVRLAEGQEVTLHFDQDCRVIDAGDDDDPNLLQAEGTEGRSCLLVDDRQNRKDDCVEKDGATYCPDPDPSWSRMVIIREGETYSLPAVDRPPVTPNTPLAAAEPEGETLHFEGEADADLFLADMQARLAQIRLDKLLEATTPYEAALSDSNVSEAARELLIEWRETAVRELEAQAVEAEVVLEAGGPGAVR